MELDRRACVAAVLAVGAALAPAAPGADGGAGSIRRESGYRGIWFTLGQMTPYGDKYSGGLGTYTANHVPIAIYSPQADRTFFTYGGTLAGKRHLLVMASYYDHRTGRVPRPIVVCDKNGVDDPHDNGSLCIDGAGHIWVAVSGRAKSRPGFRYRSRKPHDIDAGFDLVWTGEMTYPQPHWCEGHGFLDLFTKYTAGRELYFASSGDGRTWSPDTKLAAMGGHYQVSGAHGSRIGTFFNMHPGGSPDRRTNLYYMETPDRGRTWTTAAGGPLALPLADEKNPALAIDYRSQGKLMYGNDLAFTREGRPVLFQIIGTSWMPGPEPGPRDWMVTQWTGKDWRTVKVTSSDHNYDHGSLYISGDDWHIIGPSLPGPQPWGVGGEMCLWRSRDAGATWALERQITRNSPFNHAYARRPAVAKDPFHCFWADGDPTCMSESHLYFCNSDGSRVWRLPYDMPGETAEPVETSFMPSPPCPFSPNAPGIQSQRGRPKFQPFPAAEVRYAVARCLLVDSTHERTQEPADPDRR